MTGAELRGETMKASDGQLSPSGVFIAKDFRDNLIIDRYDPVFADMRASKIEHLRSANSEDAVTWNVFRSLRQITPSVWLPALWKRAFPDVAVPLDLRVVVKLWQSVPPPLGLLDTGDEGPSEIDVVLEAPRWVWLIEAKYRSDISLGTTTRPTRDQVLRNVDVGTYYAGVRACFFSLLISDEQKSPEGVRRVQQYRDLSVPRGLLRDHRPDGLQNLQGVGLLSWGCLADVLEMAANTASQEDERLYATRAIQWLKEKGIGGRE